MTLVIHTILKFLFIEFNHISGGGDEIHYNVFPGITLFYNTRGHIPMTFEHSLEITRIKLTLPQDFVQDTYQNNRKGFGKC